MMAAEKAGKSGPEATSQAEHSIHLTDIAAERIRGTLQREGLAGYGVRLAAAGGGCSGFQYQLTFEKQPNPDDVVWELSGLLIFVDGPSKDHLRGVTLDYVTGLHAAGFKFINPNASRTCGCGA
jgi:iron-sulfur cluster assembly accessory protein